MFLPKTSLDWTKRKSFADGQFGFGIMIPRSEFSSSSYRGCLTNDFT